MKNLLALILVFGILSLTFVTTAEAIVIYIGPGEYKQVFYLNVSTFQPASTQGKYEVKNYNNYTIQVSFNITGELTQIIEIPESVILEPNQTDNVYFTITASEPGVYNGNVQVAYRSYGLNRTGALIEPEITVYVNKVPGIFDFLIPALAIVAVAIIGFVLYKKMKKAKGKRK